MRAVLEHSWVLLSDVQREAFKKLSVFRGGFTREAALEAADASLRTLSALVDKSWLRWDAVYKRYDFHELLRQYGQEHLQADKQEWLDATNRLPLLCSLFRPMLARSSIGARKRSLRTD